MAVPLKKRDWSKYSRSHRVKRKLEIASGDSHELDEYFQVLNKMELILKENEILRKKLFQIIQVTETGEPNENVNLMLKVMLDSAKENAGKRPQGHRYNNIPLIKELGALFLILGGPYLYEIISKNLSLPALSTTSKFVNSTADPVEESVFRFDELRSFLDKRNLPREVVIEVDATAVTQRAQYDPKTNQVCGLKPTLNSFGLPIANSFPAVSAQKIKEYIENNTLSSVAFAVMARPLAHKAPAFCLGLYGSDNRFDASQADKSLQYIASGCARKGITVRGISTDGDSRYLKTMLTRTLSLNPHHQWSWLGVCDLDPSCFYVQDTIHLLVKLKSKLLQASVILPFGPRHIISRGHIVDLIHHFSKDLHVLTISCVNPRDKMNFRAAEKLCSAKVSELLRLVPGCEGTAMYLDMMRGIKEAYLSATLSPLERIEMFWKWVFVLRMWRCWILNTDGYSLGNNFITSNAYSCIELNGHALILMCRHFRDASKPELFRPSDFTSQDAEDFFRNLRALSTFKSSQTTFTIQEMKHKVRRLDYLAELHSKLDGKVTFPRAKKLLAKEDAVSVNQILPDDTDIQSAVMRSFKQASEICRAFGIDPPLLPPPLALSPAIFKSSYNFNAPGEEENEDVEEEDGDFELVEADLEEGDSFAVGAACFEEEDEEEENMIEDLIVASTGSLGLKTYDNVVVTETCPFVKVKDGNGKVCIIRKSTWIWLLLSGDTKLSSDRLERVKSMQTSRTNTAQAQTTLSKPTKEDTVFIGDWCAFRDKKKIFIGRIESFSYLSGTSLKNQEYSLLSAPTTAPCEKSRGLGCMCSWFTLSSSRQKTLIPVTMDVHGYFDLKFYICNIPRPKVVNNKFVVDFTLAQLEKVSS